MLRSVVFGLSVALLVACGSFSSAQTGPSSSTTLEAAVNQQAGVGMSPERLAEVLRKLGHQAEVRSIPLNGQTVYTVVAQVSHDGWRFDLEFEYSVNQKNFNLICVLGPASRFTTTQLFNLLKKNYDLAPPVHFSIRGGDQKLLLEDPMFSAANLTDQTVQNIVNSFVQKVRGTYELWK